MYHVKDMKRGVLMGNAESGTFKPYSYPQKASAEESARQWQYLDDNDNLESMPNRFVVVGERPRITPSYIKNNYEANNPEGHFFTRNNMKFSGDTMSNYASSAVPVKVKTIRGTIHECYELRRKKPVKGRLTCSSYFEVDTFKIIQGEQL